MSVTALRLPPDLKKRVAKLAKDMRQSPHAFMVEAIAEKTELTARRLAFLRDAVAAQRESNETGTVYDAAEVHAYMRARAKGEKAKRPRARRWRK
jgi:predicted transcriptional regulator